MKFASIVLLLLLSACAFQPPSQSVGPGGVQQSARPWSQSVGPGGVQQGSGPYGPSQSVGPGGVQQSTGPYGPSQSVGPGGVRQSAGGTRNPPPRGPSCRIQCSDETASVECPAGKEPSCQCQAKPYATCRTPPKQ